MLKTYSSYRPCNFHPLRRSQASTPRTELAANLVPGYGCGGIGYSIASNLVPGYATVQLQMFLLYTQRHSAPLSPAIRSH